MKRLLLAALSLALFAAPTLAHAGAPGTKAQIAAALNRTAQVRNAGLRIDGRRTMTLNLLNGGRGMVRLHATSSDFPPRGFIVSATFAKQKGGMKIGNLNVNQDRVRGF